MEDITGDAPASENRHEFGAHCTSRLAPEALERIEAVAVMPDQLIERMDLEVKTRRLVVVGDDGFVRVVVASAGSHGQVTFLSVRGGASGSTSVELYAHDSTEGDRAKVDLALVDRGDVGGVFSLFKRRGARLRCER